MLTIMIMNDIFCGHFWKLVFQHKCIWSEYDMVHIIKIVSIGLNMLLKVIRQHI